MRHIHFEFEDKKYQMIAVLGSGGPAAQTFQVDPKLMEKACELLRQVPVITMSVFGGYIQLLVPNNLITYISDEMKNASESAISLDKK